MNKEVKESIDYLKNYVNDIYSTYTVVTDRKARYLKTVLDYITSLEQANKNTYETSQDLLSEMQQKIDKAIEFINQYNIYFDDSGRSHEYIPKELLKILKGE